MSTPRATRSLLVSLMLVAAACSGSAAGGDTTISTTTEPIPPTTTTAPIPPTTTPGSSTSGSAPPTTTVPPTYPRFESKACIDPDLASLARGETHDIECGDVIVLENRDEPAGQTVSLPVVVARTLNPNPEPDPVIYLAGGGGHDHLSNAFRYLGWVGDAILENRDFIQYNQRGAPGTKPELTCPGYTEFLYDLAGRPELDSMWTAEHSDYLNSCRQALRDSG